MERRRFTREFKLEAVRLIRDRGVSYAQASEDLKVHPTQLRNWVKAFAEDPQHAFPGQGPANDPTLPTSSNAISGADQWCLLCLAPATRPVVALTGTQSQQSNHSGPHPALLHCMLPPTCKS